MSVRTCLVILLTLSCAWLCPAEAEPLRIAAVGDIMLAGRYAPIIAAQGPDYPFAATATTLQKAHLAIGNLEAPLTNRGREYRDKRFRFRAPPATAGALQRAGFTVLTLANNHILDYGSTGLADTMRALGAAQLLTTGAGSTLAQAREPALLTRAGRRVAVLAYSLTQPTDFLATSSRAGTAPAYAPLIVADVRRAREQAEVVIVAIHWGGELETMPRPAQRALAHQIIDAGATVILGHHPHVLQGVEYYDQGLICYSLGNFTFGSGSRAATRSMIAMLTIPDTGGPEIEIIPLTVDNRATKFQPRILTGSEAAAAITDLDRLSQPLRVRIVADGPRFRAIPMGVTHAPLYRPTALR